MFKWFVFQSFFKEKTDISELFRKNMIPTEKRNATAMESLQYSLSEK